MSRRVITAISYDLKFIVSADFPPPCSVAFTDITDDSHEEPGRVTFLDADAQTMWTATDKIAAANTLLDAKAKALPDLPTIAARMTAVDDLDAQLRARQVHAAAIDEQLEVKRQMLANADALIQLRQVEVTALETAKVEAHAQAEAAQATAAVLAKAQAAAAEAAPTPAEDKPA